MLILLIFLLLMVLSPIIVRFAEKINSHLTAMALSYIGYCWMGFLFIFCSAVLLIDIYHFTVYLVSTLNKNDLSSLYLSTKLALFLPVILAIIINFYGYFKALEIKVNRIVIKSTKIPKEIESLKIVQISDVHLGLIVREKRLKKILDKISEINPDILVSTGDLLDGQGDNLKPIAKLFQNINPKYGKFAVFGNHEFYVGLEESRNLTKEAGFHILRGKNIEIKDLINIAGFDDPTSKSFVINKEISELTVLKQGNPELFTLLLKHTPIVNNYSLGLFDLQLSGHTHNGQIFPFNMLVKLFYPYIKGLIDLAEGSQLYVSSGSGTWGPPVRFLSLSEVTLFEISRI
jgi:uncharacterized protein